MVSFILLYFSLLSFIITKIIKSIFKKTQKNVGKSFQDSILFFENGQK